MPVWKQAMCTRSGANDACKQIFWMFVDQVYVIFFFIFSFCGTLCGFIIFSSGAPVPND